MNCPHHDCPQDIHCPCDDKIEQDRLSTQVENVYLFANGKVIAFRGDAQTPDLQYNLVLDWARNAINCGYNVHESTVHFPGHTQPSVTATILVQDGVPTLHWGEYRRNQP